MTKKNPSDAGLFDYGAAPAKEEWVFAGKCRSESSIAPLLKQRFAQLATGAIDDSSPSRLSVREERCRRRKAVRFCFAQLRHGGLLR